MDEAAVDLSIAENLKRLRAARGLTLEGLSERSGVSRAMISRIERAEASPTALLLARLCAALGTSLSAFFADADKPVDPLSRYADQPIWRDPETGYIRRAVSPQGIGPDVDIVAVTFPAGARIAFPPEPAAAGASQYLWLIEGEIEVTIEDQDYRLGSGDCLFMEIALPHVFSNSTNEDARYAMVIHRGGR
ncbi:helix-turn-helix domain-containing protein [Martelella endophytica]|uniref:DNA-binding protein n=1 Tax=Martelella endophytica TaxID=1486262 RepID=A0A0D5LR04_MAREN|nr:helix-turn-helix domain-containing protein [Martelella endophytica]AJY46202.1 DNA-binding protein [Martelella endophytica]